MDRRPSLFGLSTYPFAPPRFGGALRVHHLANAYARHFDVLYCTQKLRLPRIVRPERTQVAPHLVEWQGLGASGAAGSLLARRAGLPQLAYEFTLNWLPAEARAALRIADVIVLEQPWSYRWARHRRRPHQRIVASTHNVESDLFEESSMRLPARVRPELKRLVERREREALAGADLVVACTAADRDAMLARFGLDAARVVVVDNGVDASRYRPISEAERPAAKRRVGLDERRAVVVFTGSWHVPNVRAVEALLSVAASWQGPAVQFLVIGSVGDRFRDVDLPNVCFTGFVDDVRPWLEAGDAFVNPMTEGSGSNIKLFEAMAAGLPALSTPFGARGIAATDGVDLVTASLETFASRLQVLLSADESRERIRRSARELVESRYDWKALGATLAERLVALVAESPTG